MSDHYVIHCPGCSSLFKSIRGLQQHLLARVACAAFSQPNLVAAPPCPVDNRVSGRPFHQYTAPVADRPVESPLPSLWLVEDVALPADLTDNPSGPIISGQTFTPDVSCEAVDRRVEINVALLPLIAQELLMDNHNDDTFLMDDNASPAFCELPEPPAGLPFTAATASEDVPLPPFSDRMHGCYSAEELLSIRLLKLLRAIGAPHYAYRSIMDFFADAQQAKASVTAGFRSRDSAIKHFADRFQLAPLQATTITKRRLGRSYPCVMHQARAMIESLLYSSLMVEANMLFPNSDDPLGPLPATVEIVGDIDSGRYYRAAHQRLKTAPNVLPCPILAYMDKIALDCHGHLSLEGWYFTIGLFQRRVRNKPGAWRPLGYMPNLGLLSKSENKYKLDSLQKVQLYHEILTDIFESLMALMDGGGIPFTFQYRGKEYTVLLVFYVLVVIGDTEGHDRHCGRYNSRSLATKKLCRHCDIPTLEVDNPDYPWRHLMPGDVSKLVEAKDLDGLKAISQHYVQNAYYNPLLCLGGIPRGIHGMTPGEPLHVIDLGIFKYLIESFCIAMGMNPIASSRAPTKMLSHIDSMARRVGRFLGHQGDRGLPRTYFPFGITGGTKLAGHEYLGVMLVLLVMCHMQETRQLFLTKITPLALCKWTRLFELMIGWRCWLKRDTIPRAEVERADRAMTQLMEFYKVVIQRTHGNGTKFIKFHLVRHFVENILDLGVMPNFDSGPPESNHKVNGKQTSERTQLRADLLEAQTAK